MSRDTMRAELRRLRSQNNSLHEENKCLLMENYLLRKRNNFPYIHDPSIASLREIKHRFDFSDFSNVPDYAVKERAMAYFLQDISKMIRDSGKVVQEVNENYVETRLTLCLY